MKEIVKYHNDFNKIKVPSLGELEQNLLMLIISSVKETKVGEKKILNVETLQKAFVNDYKNKTEIGEYLLTLRENFFKADFQILIRKENKVGIKYINLFNDFALVYEEPEDKPQKDWTNFVELELSINPEFEYLLNELTANFTRFELAEFIALSGKYTKTLYRLLKQYRQTGLLKMEWDEFAGIMDIPSNYRQIDIDQRILKPAIKELTKSRNLFDKVRIPFENLTYTKLKGKGRGRGGNVIGIEFSFKKQEKEQELTKPAKSIAISQNKSNDIKPNLNAYAGIHLHDVTTQAGKFDGKIISVFNNLENDKYVVTFKWENGEQNSQEMTKEKLEWLVETFQA